MKKIWSEAVQKRSEMERPLTDLEAQILELYRKLPAVQKKMILLSAALSAAANDKKEWTA